MLEHEIIPSSLAVKAMRDSGYRDSAHAIAELVDNSIQAGAQRVEVICTDKVEKVQTRVRRRIDKIAVYDNGCGMDADTLRKALQFGNGTHLRPEEQDGIGKFGMGLPNSSISQCERVDVWTWQDGVCLYSYLDVEDIQSGRMKVVPEPVPSTLPDKWTGLISEKLCKHGTLVVWSRPDRIRWKTSRALLGNSSLIIGRMYRYFVHQGKAVIRLAAFSPANEGWKNEYDEPVLPNDPIYLMSGTSCPALPAPYDKEAMFELWAEETVCVVLPDGTKHDVMIRCSIVKHNVRKKLAEIGGGLPGSTEPGKHAAANIGVSVVRAGRELEMNQTFAIGYDPRERWWGVEVSFPPALDDVFGVTNNKQAATAFCLMNIDTDAEAEGMTAAEYKEQLKAENDPRLAIYDICARINANLKPMRAQIIRLREGAKKKEEPLADSAEVAATNATRARKDDGHVGASDREEELSPEERKEDLARQLEGMGADPEDAREIAVSHVDSGLKYVFQEGTYDGPSFFSVASKGGAIIVTLNASHPAANYLYGLLESGGDDNSRALDALKVMLCAWARMEDESQSDIIRSRLADMRNDWGRLARDFLHAAFEDG